MPKDGRSWTGRERLLRIRNLTIMHGQILKLKSVLHASDQTGASVQYWLPIGDKELALDPYLGKTLSLKFNGEICCVYCQRKTKKSFNQGYCFPCAQKLARCDVCIVKPEKCHYHLQTCREPEWAKTHCFIPHIVYLANTSGVKVGITRSTQIPTRWIDQGAIQALPILKAQSRYQSGLAEVALKSFVNDKTDWRKMLKGEEEPTDLFAKRDELFDQCKFDFSALEALEQATITSIHYPVLEYPKKIVSLNLEKTPDITGTLLGIKGQYLIFDIGVINIRNATGYHISVNV